MTSDSLPSALRAAMPAFTVLGRLGRGATGEVLRVRRGGSEFALKWGEREAIAREHSHLARIDHPNVVRSLEVYAADDSAAHWMPVVPGAPFPGFVRERVVAGSVRRNLPQAFGYTLQEEGQSQFAPCSPAQLVALRALIAQVAAGLAAIHAAGLLHLDIAPDNVAVQGGSATVLDLGIARARDQAFAPTTLVGSAAYLAPEVAQRPCTASDAYSLGVMAFEALTGSLPFAGGGPEVLVRKQSLSAPRASEMVEGVPEDLDALCAALLSRAPADRPAMDTLVG